MEKVDLDAVRQDIEDFVAANEGRVVSAKTIKRRMFAPVPASLRAVAAEAGYSAVFIRKVERQLRDQLMTRQYPALYTMSRYMESINPVPVSVTDLSEEYFENIPGLDIDLITALTRLNPEYHVVQTVAGSWLIHERLEPETLKRNIEAESVDGITDITALGESAPAFRDYVSSAGWYFLDPKHVVSAVTPVTATIRALLTWYGELGIEDIIAHVTNTRSVLGRDISELYIRNMLRDNPEFVRVSKYGWALEGNEHVDGLSTMVAAIEKAGAEGASLKDLEEEFVELGYSARSAHAYSARPEFKRTRGRVTFA